MNSRECLEKIKKLGRDYKNLEATIQERRFQGFRRSVENGTLERFLQIAVPVSAGIYMLGTYINNKEVASIGLGALFIGAVYSFALQKR